VTGGGGGGGGRRSIATLTALLAIAVVSSRAGATAIAPPPPPGVAAVAADTAHRAPRHGSAKGRRRRKQQGKKPHPPKRAKVGERVPVEITYYCLQGTTRTDRPTRDGIVAADPRVFPLRRHVELFFRGESLGRFLVDDTGALVRGHVVDVWVPSCGDARRRGRRRGIAVLLKKGAVVSEGLAAK
jgi:3D (Asp-Asp-Asp) domain-containing protein